MPRLAGKPICFEPKGRLWTPAGERGANVCHGHVLVHPESFPVAVGTKGTGDL